MTRAYAEVFVDDAADTFGNAMDFAVNGEGLKPERFCQMFLESGLADEFGRGNPRYVSGMSGTELAREVQRICCSNVEPSGYERDFGYSAEYWAGWALTYYQWWSGRSFADILARVPIEQVLDMYSVYHEMSLEQFYDAVDLKFSANVPDTKLSVQRKLSGMTQEELAEESGVNIRSIQMYEQRENDIDKAQARNIYRLARALNCRMEDLLEDPSR